MWLAKTMGGLITVIGAAMVTDAKRGDPSNQAKALAAGSALVLGASDLIYGGRGRNTRVYYLDAAAQAALLAGLGADR